MKKSKICFLLILILNVFSAILAYGKFIEIKGAVSYFIFALPIIITIIFLKGKKKYPELFFWYCFLSAVVRE